MKLNKFVCIGLIGILSCSLLFLSGCGIKKGLSKSVNSETEKKETEAQVLSPEQIKRYAEIEQKLAQIDDLLDHYYLNDEDIDPQVMEDYVMKGYVESLGERYTTYYSAEEFASLQETTSGEYEGIGMLVSQNVDTKVITIIQVFDNGPGDKAGLKPGDILTKVNGADILDKDVSLVVKDIKGEVGTPVTITIYRPENDEYIDMTMNREKIEQPTVSHEMMEDQIGYIYVSSIDEITEKQFNEAVDDLLNQGMKGLVIDLRNNPGGLLTTVCHMLDRILPADQLLVYTIDKNDKRVDSMTTDDEMLDIPMSVIVNGNSASAAEIFTAALKDYQKAEIVGQTTFGKGIVQVIVPLSDGSAVKMTSSKYYTPKGECIHEIGVTPDIELANDVETEIDEQLEAAVNSVKEQIAGVK